MCATRANTVAGERRIAIERPKVGAEEEHSLPFGPRAPRGPRHQCNGGVVVTGTSRCWFSLAKHSQLWSHGLSQVHGQIWHCAQVSFTELISSWIGSVVATPVAISWVAVWSQQVALAPLLHALEVMGCCSLLPPRRWRGGGRG